MVHQYLLVQPLLNGQSLVLKDSLDVLDFNCLPVAIAKAAHHQSDLAAIDLMLSWSIHQVWVILELLRDAGFDETRKVINSHGFSVHGVLQQLLN